MQKIFESDRLYFRRFTFKDVGRVTYLFNDEEVSKYFSSLPFPYKESHAKEWIGHQNENFKYDLVYDFAIVDKRDDRIIGSISMFNVVKHKKTSIGYMIGRDYWGRGYATEALKAVIEYAFSIKGFHKLYAQFIEGNLASERVMQKAGMIFESKRYHEVLKNDRFLNTIVYYLLNDTNVD
ncbi:MAG: GNAT family N-acetyltransferase [Tissierellia bacterium]|nr:GNAT family N-acetyltransferase [Tissierellia bacterium]